MLYWVVSHLSLRNVVFFVNFARKLPDRALGNSVLCLPCLTLEPTSTQVVNGSRDTKFGLQESPQ